MYFKNLLEKIVTYLAITTIKKALRIIVLKLAGTNFKDIFCMHLLICFALLITCFGARLVVVI